MPSSDSTGFSEIKGVLETIGVSALIVFAGSILSQLMGFGTRVAIARFLPVDGYGEIALGITLLNIAGILSVTGLGKALTRFLPQADTGRERADIVTSIYHIGIGLSVLWSSTLFVAADFIAVTVFDAPGTSIILRIFSLTIPFFVFYRLSLRGIQGHKWTVPNVLTKQFVRPLVQLLSIAVLSLLGFGAAAMSVGYGLGFVVGGIVGFLVLVTIGKYDLSSFFVPAGRDRYREIITFSAPLTVSASFGIITKRSDIFLLGVLASTRAVAVYEVAFLVSQFMLFFGPVLNYLFQPIVSEMYSQNDRLQMDHLYTIITKWLVLLTFPVFALLLLFPEALLSTLFGGEYGTGALALQLLAVGFYADRLFGLTGSFLTATGDTDVLMYVSGGSAILNVGLNLVLIPRIGIVGAAIATVSTTFLNNLVQALYIYKSVGIHPYTWDLVVPTTLGIVVLTVAKVANVTVETGILGGILVAGCFGTLLLLFVILTRSLYHVELLLLDTMFEHVGLRLQLVERLAMFTRSDEDRDH